MDGCAVDAKDLAVTPDLAVAYERIDAVVAEPPSSSSWASTSPSADWSSLFNSLSIACVCAPWSVSLRANGLRRAA